MRRQNRFTSFLATPLVVLLWVFGWTLYWIGSDSKLVKLKKRSDNIGLGFRVLMPEQKYAE